MDKSACENHAYIIYVTIEVLAYGKGPAYYMYNMTLSRK